MPTLDCAGQKAVVDANGLRCVPLTPQEIEQRALDAERVAMSEPPPPNEIARLKQRIEALEAMVVKL